MQTHTAQTRPTTSRNVAAIPLPPRCIRCIATRGRQRTLPPPSPLPRSTSDRARRLAPATVISRPARSASISLLHLHVNGRLTLGRWSRIAVHDGSRSDAIGFPARRLYPRANRSTLYLVMAYRLSDCSLDHPHAPDS